MGKLYSVIYQGVDLFDYKMTHQESAVIENFRHELIDICNQFDVPRGKLFDGSPYMGRLLDNSDFVMKFGEDVGFFVLTGERGEFSLMQGFPVMSREEARFILLEQEFVTGGFLYELKVRDQLVKEWPRKYGVDYDARKAAFEYGIQLLKKIFQHVPEETIGQYTNYMNRWFDTDHWYFDSNSGSFEEV